MISRTEKIFAFFCYTIFFGAVLGFYLHKSAGTLIFLILSVLLLVIYSVYFWFFTEKLSSPVYFFGLSVMTPEQRSATRKLMKLWLYISFVLLVVVLLIWLLPKSFFA